ncbi:MAG: HK97 family phage prohead protease, partial [Clostridia bacterium]|nr:HK97 family phage prohead protease [Clostridia bacterium]
MMEQRQIQSDFNVTDNRTVEGYAVVFESESENIGWREIIHKGAITEETIKNSDIFAKFNHDSNKILARSKYGNGSLLIEVDDNGVR